MRFPYENPVDPESVGIDSEKLDKVVKKYEDQNRSGQFPGGQLVLRRRGKLVLNNALGVARGFRVDDAAAAVEVRPDTAFPVLSAGKSLAATAVALLEDRGLLDIEAPIAEVFPEFARNGKGEITTLDVLTHCSGLLMPEFVSHMEQWSDKEAVQSALINAVPSHPRGTLAYHPHEYGWILSEIVERIDGRTLTDFFAYEIGDPLGLDALQFGLAGRDLDTVAFTYWMGKEKVMVAGSNVAKDFEAQNSELFFRANNPAVSLVTDAASLAAFYEFLQADGRANDGSQLISQKTLRRYTSRNVYSWDRSLNTPLAVGRGFIVGSTGPSSFGWWRTNQCFGHAGGFCTLAFADYHTKISATIVTNGNRGLTDFFRRFVPLAHGLRKACI